MKPLAAVVAIHTTAMDPLEELLLGPAFAIPGALDAARLRLDEVGVLKSTKPSPSRWWPTSSSWPTTPSPGSASGGRGRGQGGHGAAQRVGGSLSIGHPFGATEDASSSPAAGGWRRRARVRPRGRLRRRGHRKRYRPGKGGAMSVVTVNKRPDGVAVLLMDQPGSP